MLHAVHDGAGDTGDVDMIESVCVLPGADQDRVYFAVKRRVNGAWVRHIEKLAYDVDAAPLTVCKVMDSFVEGTSSSTTITLSHLKGRTVYAWVDGAPVEDARARRRNSSSTSRQGRSRYRWRRRRATASASATSGFMSRRASNMACKANRRCFPSKPFPQLALILLDYCRQGIPHRHARCRRQRIGGGPADARRQQQGRR